MWWVCVCLCWWRWWWNDLFMLHEKYPFGSYIEHEPQTVIICFSFHFMYKWQSVDNGRNFDPIASIYSYTYMIKYTLFSLFIHLKWFEFHYYVWWWHKHKIWNDGARSRTFLLYMYRMHTLNISATTKIGRYCCFSLVGNEIEEMRYHFGW